MTSGRLAGYLSGSLARPTVSRIDLASELGSDLHHLYQPSLGAYTIDGSSNFSQLNDSKGGAHATQGTAGNRPALDLVNGPNGKAVLTIQDVNRRMTLPINFSAGHRIGIYCVCSMPAGATLQYVVEIGESNDVRIGKTDIGGGTPGFYHRWEFTGGDQQLNITSPAFDTNWNLRAYRPLSTGALSQINGVTTTPGATGADTQKAWASTSRIGSLGAFGAGSLAMLAFTAEPVDAIDTIVRAYVAQEFAIT